MNDNLGTCFSCCFWWSSDGFCPRLGIIRQPTFGCTEYRDRFIDEKVCKTCTYYNNSSGFCKFFTIVVENSHGCRKHSL